MRVPVGDEPGASEFALPFIFVKISCVIVCAAEIFGLDAADTCGREQ
jgi:hypothetical protein